MQEPAAEAARVRELRERLATAEAARLPVAEAAAVLELQERLASAEAARLRAETVQRRAAEDAELRHRRVAARHEAELQVSVRIEGQQWAVLGTPGFWPGSECNRCVNAKYAPLMSIPHLHRVRVHHRLVSIWSPTTARCTLPTCATGAAR